MKLEHIELDTDVGVLAQTLKKMQAREQIPAPQRRTETRARLMKRYGGMNLTAFETRIGWIGLAYSEHGVAAIKLPRASRSQTLADLKRDFPKGVCVENAPTKIARELSEYAEGRRRRFELKLDWSAIKPFQRAVLQAAFKIPFGETRTYGWIAREIGKPQASRAVGRALATNPIPIVLPCHRVLASDGGLHGYAGGLPLKKKLLQLEGALA
jgi:methylated-DNA-[protein]-cysteine S-methyltransferase